MSPFFIHFFMNRRKELELFSGGKLGKLFYAPSRA